MVKMFNLTFETSWPLSYKNSKVDKDFARKLDLKDIKRLVKIRDIYKMEKKIFISISVLGYENVNELPVSVSKITFK